MFVMFDVKLSGKSVQRYTFIAYNEPLGLEFLGIQVIHKISRTNNYLQP